MIIAAHVGDLVVIQVLGAFSEQVQLFSVPGHEWKHEPYMSGADLVSTMEFGGAEVMIAWPILGSQERGITVKPHETVSLDLSFENK